MAQETIQAIRDAENSSTRKELDARKQAEQLIEQAKTDAAALMRSRTDAVKQEGDAALADADRQNEAAVAKAKEEAAQEIETLRTQVRAKEDEAVALVMRELIS